MKYKYINNYIHYPLDPNQELLVDNNNCSRVTCDPVNDGKATIREMTRDVNALHRGIDSQLLSPFWSVGSLARHGIVLDEGNDILMNHPYHEKKLIQTYNMVRESLLVKPDYVPYPILFDDWRSEVCTYIIIYLCFLAFH